MQLIAEQLAHQAFSVTQQPQDNRAGVRASLAGVQEQRDGQVYPEAAFRLLRLAQSRVGERQWKR